MIRPRAALRCVFMIPFLALALGGCKKTTVMESALKDFAYDAKARNFAVLAGSDGSMIRLGAEPAPVLKGVPPDIANWWSLFCPNQPLPQAGVRVPAPGTKLPSVTPCEGPLGKFEIVYLNQKTTSAEDLRAAFRWVGENLENNSTLVFTYSGHGAENGDLYVNPASPWWPFGDILGESPRQRNVRGARFYFFNDSCFSGKLVNDNKSEILRGGKSSASLTEGEILDPPLNDGYTGPSFRRTIDPSYVETATVPSVEPSPSGTPAPFGAALTDAPSAPTNTLVGKAEAQTQAITNDVGKGPAFAQAVIFSAANSIQTAADAGEAVGGAFTASLKRVFEFYIAYHKDHASDPGANPSLQRVFNDIAWAVKKLSPPDKEQVPQYRVAPACVLSEKFMITGQTAEQRGCITAIGGTGATTIQTTPSGVPSTTPSGVPAPTATP